MKLSYNRYGYLFITILSLISVFLIVYLLFSVSSAGKAHKLYRFADNMGVGRQCSRTAVEAVENLWRTIFVGSFPSPY